MKKDNNNNINILYWVIIVLALLLAILAWYCFGKTDKNTSNVNNINNVWDTPLVLQSEKIWLDKDDLKECIANGDKYLEKINTQQELWSNNFWITWTPGNVLINNETWEYSVISGAYPKESFIAIIDNLLSEEAVDAKEDNTDKKDFVENTNTNTLVIISDKRDTASPVDQLLTGLQEVEWIKDMNFVEYDFSDNNVKEYLENNKIVALPAILFAKSKVDEKVDSFLSQINYNTYSLNIWAKFNPFDEMSDKWFKVIDKDIIKEIRDISYIDWNEDAKITWLEYSDLECPFCAKLHNSDVESSLKEKYGNDLNIIFNHFPLDFHKKAIPWAQILECVWEQGWSEAFYSILKYAFENEIQE